MARKIVRVALVGAGAAAQINHIPAYRKLKDVEIVALCEPDHARAQAVSQRFQIPHVFDDLQDMLRADLDVDAVDICTPTHLHAPMALAALGDGKHVLIERPFARRTSEAEAVVAAAARADRVAMVAFNHRFRPDAQMLWQFVRKGELGQVYFGKAGWLRGRVAWRGGKENADVSAADNGVLMDLGVQMLDLALWIMGGKVVTVSSSVHRLDKNATAEDAAIALLRLDSGATITLEVSWSLLQDKDFAFVNVFGDRGAALFNPLRLHKMLHGNFVNVTPPLRSEKNLYKRSYEIEIDHFVDCVRRNATPVAGAEEALALMRVLDAVYRSAESGKEVRLG